MKQTFIKLSHMFLFAFLLCNSTYSQNEYNSYQEALNVALDHYDTAQYQKAAIAFSEAFKIGKRNEYPYHRLFAAASYCMIDNELGVKENLFALLPMSTSKDMKKVLVNYEIFNKYKDTEWWKLLESKMNKRLQDLIAHHQNLKIFKKGRSLVYKAIRINKEGDTLANTYITMIPQGTGWGNPAATSQTEVVFEYNYSSQDSLDHIDELNRVVTTEFWIKRDSTGIIENEEQVWMHPFRNNEFFKTEIAPFPQVNYPISAETMEAEKPRIIIMKNWGSYSESETESEYAYLGEESRSYNSLGELDCHSFHAESFNNFHGISKIDYYFNEDLGFVEMNYETYDGDIMTFVLEKVVSYE